MQNHVDPTLTLCMFATLPAECDFYKPAHIRSSRSSARSRSPFAGGKLVLLARRPDGSGMANFAFHIASPGTTLSVLCLRASNFRGVFRFRLSSVAIHHANGFYAPVIPAGRILSPEWPGSWRLSRDKALLSSQMRPKEFLKPAGW